MSQNGPVSSWSRVSKHARSFFKLLTTQSRDESRKRELRPPRSLEKLSWIRAPRTPRLVHARNNGELCAPTCHRTRNWNAILISAHRGKFVPRFTSFAVFYGFVRSCSFLHYARNNDSITRSSSFSSCKRTKRTLLVYYPEMATVPRMRCAKRNSSVWDDDLLTFRILRISIPYVSRHT